MTSARGTISSRLLVNNHAVQLDRAGTRIVQSREKFNQSRLAGTVFPDQSYSLARTNMQ